MTQGPKDECARGLHRWLLVGNTPTGEPGVVMTLMRCSECEIEREEEAPCVHVLTTEANEDGEPRTFCLRCGATGE